MSGIVVWDAVALVLDRAWSARQFRSGTSSMAAITKTLEQRAPAEVPSLVNPLLDLGFIAEQYLGGGGNLSALDVIVCYVTELLPMGASPHPLIDTNVFRICHPETRARERSGAIRSWVDDLLAEPDRSESLILPFLDPGFVLREAGIAPGDLTARGVTSVSRLYLGEVARTGVRPHPLFDPIYAHAQRTSTLPSKVALRDPGSFLLAELGAYIRQAGGRGRASPSIGFNEDLLRADRNVAGAVRRRLYANAFHAYVANSARMAHQPLTETGIHAFANCITSRAWWKLEKNFALPRRRGRRSVDTAFLKAARQRLAKQKLLPVHASIEGDLPHAIRLGQRLSLIIHGYAASPLGRLAGVEIKVGARKKASGSFQGAPRPDAAAALGTICKPVDGVFCGFAVAWNGTADSVGPLPVVVRFRLLGAGRARLSDWFAAGTVAVETPVVRIWSGRAPTVAIAMATYNPKLTLFRAQIDSIRGQTLTDWRMVISDESSDDAARGAIRRIVAGDPRISLEIGPRVGFVGNFERALSRLDRRGPYFALSDQDDVWYPAKLETLVEAIEREKAALVYGGMRIVAEDGRMIDPSFFSWRRPHGHSVDELLLANTVTGAATLARMDLLALALPIPRYVGIYHDMWLALVAAKTGLAIHVAEILQDHVQHDGNLLGQSARKDRSTAGRLARESKAIKCFIERLAHHRSARKVCFPTMVPELTSALASVWRETVQREFLNASLVHSIGEKVTKDFLARLSLSRAAATRSQLADAEDPRKFLNIPDWLSSGAEALMRTPRRARVS